MTYFSSFLKPNSKLFIMTIAATIIATNLSLVLTFWGVSCVFLLERFFAVVFLSAAFFCSIRNRLWLICGVCDCKNLRLFALVKIRFFAYIYRNRLLLFLLLSVFYHKIYVLNVIACTKSHVNFISFVFGARILLFYFSLSYFIFTAIFWAASAHTDNKKAATTTSTNSSTFWQDQTIKTNSCTRR